MTRWFCVPLETKPEGWEAMATQPGEAIHSHVQRSVWGNYWSVCPLKWHHIGCQRERENCHLRVEVCKTCAGAVWDRRVRTRSESSNTSDQLCPWKPLDTLKPKFWFGSFISIKDCQSFDVLNRVAGVKDTQTCIPLAGIPGPVWTCPLRQLVLVHHVFVGSFINPSASLGYSQSTLTTVWHNFVREADWLAVRKVALEPGCARSSPGSVTNSISQWICINSWLPCFCVLSSSSGLVCLTSLCLGCLPQSCWSELIQIRC